MDQINSSTKPSILGKLKSYIATFKNKRAVYVLGVILILCLVVFFVNYRVVEFIKSVPSKLESVYRYDILRNERPSAAKMVRVEIGEVSKPLSYSLVSYLISLSPYSTNTDTISINDIYTYSSAEPHNVESAATLLSKLSFYSPYTFARFKDIFIKIKDGDIYVINPTTDKISKYPLPKSPVDCVNEYDERNFWKITVTPIGEVTVAWACSYTATDLYAWKFNITNGEFTFIQKVYFYDDVYMNGYGFAESDIRDIIKNTPDMAYQITYKDQVIHSIFDTYVKVPGGYPWSYSPILYEDHVNYTIRDFDLFSGFGEQTVYYHDETYLQTPDVGRSHFDTFYYGEANYKAWSAGAKGIPYKVNLIKTSDINKMISKFEDTEYLWPKDGTTFEKLNKTELAINIKYFVPNRATDLDTLRTLVWNIETGKVYLLLPETDKFFEK